GAEAVFRGRGHRRFSMEIHRLQTRTTSSELPRLLRTIQAISAGFGGDSAMAGYSWANLLGPQARRSQEAWAGWSRPGWDPLGPKRRQGVAQVLAADQQLPRRNSLGQAPLDGVQPGLTAQPCQLCPREARRRLGQGFDPQAGPRSHLGQ